MRNHQQINKYLIWITINVNHGSNLNNSVDIVTNPSATEDTECISNIGETSHFSRTESSTIPVIPVNDPSTWRLLTKIQKEAIIREGTP